MKGNIKYRKELQRSYMIAEDCNKNLIDSYCGQMILRSNIKGLAKCEVRLTEGQREVWYEISSFHTLEQVYSVKEMSYSDLHTLLLQVITVISEVEKYLLDGRQLCFEPEYLYINMDTGKAAFLFDLTEEREESGQRGKRRETRNEKGREKPEKTNRRVIQAKRVLGNMAF